jgi:hypothetical protein
MSLPDVPSNAPGEALTISPHAVTASDTPDNIIASHAGLLVRDADGVVQNFLESLSASISAPHGTPCAYEACVAFIVGAEAVQRHLQFRHPKVHQWLTTAHELIAELKLKRGSAFASARLSLRGMRTNHPVWVSFVKRGRDGPENCAATLLLGCAVLLSMEDGEPIGPGLSKQLSSLKPERAISEAQVSSMLSGEAVDIVGMDEGISALRRQWAKVLKKFGSGQPPSPSTPNERARAQVFSAALNCGASRVGGAASHRLLSDESFRRACEYARVEVLKDSFRGVLTLLVMRTGLSVDVVASMPLISATGASADFGLDVSLATVVLDLRVLVPEASQPLPGSLPARYCLEIQLPSIVKEQLQSRLARYPAAKSLEDLYPETLAPDAKSNVFPSQHEIAPTWSRLRYSLGFALRQQGINKLLVALVCGDFGIVPRSKLHYARVSSCEFRAVEQIVYKQLGLGESAGIVDPDAPGIGCAVVPTPENVRQHDELLVQAAQVARPGKAGDLPLLRTFHNAYTALVAWRLSIMLALRETQTIELDAGVDPISDTWIPIHDKTTHRDRGFQPVALGPYAAMTVLLYQQHCRSTAERAARLAGRRTEFSLWCEAVGHRHNVRLLSFVTGTDEIKGVPSRAFVSPAGLTAAASTGDENVPYVLAPDVGRKVMENELRIQGARSSDIDAHLRHFMQGQEPSSAFDTSVLSEWVRRIASAQQRVAMSLLGPPEIGLSKGFIRREAIEGAYK